MAYLFNKQGEILLAAGQSEEKAMEVAIESGAEDVMIEEGQIEIITAADNYHSVLASNPESWI